MLSNQVLILEDSIVFGKFSLSDGDSSPGPKYNARLQSETSKRHYARLQYSRDSGRKMILFKETVRPCTDPISNQFLERQMNKMHPILTKIQIPKSKSKQNKTTCTSKGNLHLLRRSNHNTNKATEIS